MGIYQKKWAIQYNGSLSPYVYDDNGSPVQPAIQDVLANATIRLAGYELLIVSREEANAILHGAKLLESLIAEKMPRLATTTCASGSLKLGKNPAILLAAPLKSKRLDTGVNFFAPLSLDPASSNCESKT